jgi:hypothetical protein
MFTFGDGPAPAAPAEAAAAASAVAAEAAPTTPAPPAPTVAGSPGSRGAVAVAAAAAPHHSKSELAALKVSDLKKMAADVGVKGASKLKKADLVAALLERQGGE